MEQRPYLRDRLISTHPDGFYVIVPAEDTSTIPLCCPICKTMMRTSDDEISWHEFFCCDKCSISWAAPRRKEWAAGWRPSADSILHEINQRPPFIVRFEVD